MEVTKTWFTISPKVVFWGSKYKNTDVALTFYFALTPINSFMKEVSWRSCFKLWKKERRIQERLFNSSRISKLENLENDCKYRNYKHWLLFPLGERGNLNEAGRAPGGHGSASCVTLTSSFCPLTSVLLRPCPPWLTASWSLSFAFTVCSASRSSSSLPLPGRRGRVKMCAMNQQGCPRCLQTHMWGLHPQKLLLLQCESGTLTLGRADTFKFIEHSNIFL